MDPLDNNTVQVSIHGKSYTIKGKADSSYISGVANYVDMKMREVEEGANAAQEEGKVAILAGMNITDELFYSYGRLNAEIKFIINILNGDKFGI